MFQRKIHNAGMCLANGPENSYRAQNIELKLFKLILKQKQESVPNSINSIHLWHDRPRNEKQNIETFNVNLLKTSNAQQLKMLNAMLKCEHDVKPFRHTINCKTNF